MASDLKYTNRDYAAIRQSMIADAPSKTPDWTNFNQGELGVVLLELLAGGLDILSYTLDVHAIETFLDTAVTQESVQAILRGIGYEMRRRTSATATVRFTLSGTYGSDITIPAGTLLGTETPQEWVLRRDAVILAGQLTVDATVYEGKTRSEGPFTATGADTQDYTLGFPDVADNFLDVYVNGVLWTEEKFVTPFPTLLTTIYRAPEDSTHTTTVKFSKYLGAVPQSGQSVEFKYVSSNAEAGNIGADLITHIISPLTIPGGLSVTVTNPDPAGGGRERETINEAKVNGPRTLRTLERAVTVQDFKDLLLMQNQVESVAAINHSGFVEIYVRLIANPTYPVFKIEPPIIFSLTTATSGGSIPATTTVYVAVTGVDANGNETNYRPVNPSSGALLLNPAQVVTGGSGSSHKVSVKLTATPSGVVSFNVYVGTALTTLRKYNGTAVTPAQIVSVPYDITSIPSVGALAPTENLAGEQNPLTGRSYYQDFFDDLESRRLLCTSFDLFNTSAVTVNVTATILVKDNYKRSLVQSAVETAVGAFFDRWALGAALYIAVLESALLEVGGVANVTVTVPSGDTTLAASQYFVVGTVTLSMLGGIT